MPRPPQPAPAVHPSRAPLAACFAKASVIVGALATQLETPGPLSRADVLAWQRHLISAANELAPVTGAGVGFSTIVATPGAGA